MIDKEENILTIPITYTQHMSILIKSILSGVIVGLILLLSKYLGPKLAGAIGGVPLIFALTYGLTIAETPEKAQGFLLGGIYGSIAGMVFIGLLMVLNFYFIKTYWINFGVAYALCFLLALSMVYMGGK